MFVFRQDGRKDGERKIGTCLGVTPPRYACVATKWRHLAWRGPPPASTPGAPMGQMGGLD